MFKKFLTASLMMSFSVNAFQIPSVGHEVDDCASPRLSPRAMEAVNKFTQLADDSAALYLFKKNEKVAVHKYYMAFLYNQEDFKAAKRFLLISHKFGAKQYGAMQKKALAVVLGRVADLNQNEVNVLNDYLLKNFGCRSVNEYKQKQARAKRLVRKNSLNFENKKKAEQLKKAALNKKRGNRIVSYIKGALKNIKGTINAPAIKKAKYDQRVVKLKAAPKDHNMRFLDKVLNSAIKQFDGKVKRQFSAFLKAN